MSDIQIARVHPLDDGVRPLLERHFALMRSTSPEESCHVMGPEDLVAAETHLFAASLDGTLVGVGGYQVIETGHAEIKSMHTVQEARGKGAGRAILDAIFASARGQGVTRVSLETGSADDFAAARSLYQAYGFTLCPPFGHYTLDPLSVFMSREI